MGITLKRRNDVGTEKNKKRRNKAILLACPRSILRLTGESGRFENQPDTILATLSGKWKMTEQSTALKRSHFEDSIMNWFPNLRSGRCGVVLSEDEGTSAAHLQGIFNFRVWTNCKQLVGRTFLSGVIFGQTGMSVLPAAGCGDPTAPNCQEGIAPDVFNTISKLRRLFHCHRQFSVFVGFVTNSPT